MAVTSAGWTVEQTSHRLLCEALRESVRAGPGAVERVGSIRYQASAVLYLLLLEHPIDRRGRCRSCPRVMIRAATPTLPDPPQGERLAAALPR
jgi:hypothetical protein